MSLFSDEDVELISDEEFEKAKQDKRPMILFIISIIVIFFVFILPNINSSDSSKSTAKEAKCEWCGKYKSCHKYQVTQLDGYNKDGSYKYKTTYVWICDGCRDDAEKNGIEYGWVSITQTDT